MTLHEAVLPRRAVGINVREDFDFPSRCICGFLAIRTINRGVYRVWVGKPEGKRPLGRHRRRWEGSGKMGIQEAGSEGMGWIDLARDRDKWGALVNAVKNLRVP